MKCTDFFGKLLMFLVFFLALSRPLAAQTEPVTSPAAKTVEEQRRDILRFGTEPEIASLIQVLKNEKVTYLDADLIEISGKTRNRNILSGIFGFFGETGKKGLEERAIRALRERDEEANETVLAAIDYLGRVKAGEAAGYLIDLIGSGENRFLNSAIRSLGRVGGAVELAKLPEKDEPPVQAIPEDEPADTALLETAGAEAENPGPLTLQDRTAFFLLEYYKDRNPSDENKREIIVALGETQSREGISFLAGIATNNDERAPLRISALGAISKIADDEGLDAVIAAVSSTDPNVRSSAVAALGPFTGEAVENAILEGFRDSYYRTRIGAAAAAGQRGLESAVPFLRFRAQNDDVPAVREEAVKALGAINNSETMSILDSLFMERRNSDRVRLVAAEMLLRNDADNYCAKVGIEMDEAKKKNQTPLYNGFIRIMGPVKSPALEDFARRLISSGGVIEKSLAMDLILNNEFRGLETSLRSLLDEKIQGASIARKAKSVLERLGFQVEG